MPFWWNLYGKKKKKLNVKKGKDQSGEVDSTANEEFENNLVQNVNKIIEITGNSSDIVIRKMMIAKKVKIAVIYTDGLVDGVSINDFLLEGIIQNNDDDLGHPISAAHALHSIQEKMIAIGEIKSIFKWDDLFLSLLSGETIILIDGAYEALSVSTVGGEKRQISEPGTETTIRGSREGFTETLRTNTSLIRRRIKNPNLWLESMKLGTVTQTDVAIMYINGIANDNIIKEVKTRLNRIDIDSILETGYIEQLIEDQTFTTFPTLNHTERPDVVAANLLEGRIAVFVDGTPFVLTAPALFVEFFQAADDYYSRFDITSGIRLLRALAFIISLIAPSVYIAATTFHQEMIPTLLVISIAAQRESVPFPAFVEAIVMEVIFEILREAGVRLPKAIGQTVSIVGALVIGQAAVQAGIVSPAMVIIVSITAIANFSIPSFAMAISARLIRFIFMVLAATFGLYGLILGLIVMTIHLCSLRSFGIPYMSPLAPLIPTNVGDSVIRMPKWVNRERPRLINQKNIVRSGNNQKPHPPSQNQPNNKKDEPE
ncbi:spore germination protein [Heyndrickxia sp. NPDC080065]|uniref:spore germination protein n=1 Tax=Heyndrickxia sp. NPDC080065 TaxID=3390568 RepID=UPI003D01C03B